MTLTVLDFLAIEGVLFICGIVLVLATYCDKGEGK